MKTKHEITLLRLDNGSEIELVVPSSVSTDFYEEMLNALDRGEHWTPDSWDGVRATFLGRAISTIAMRRVIGFR